MIQKEVDKSLYILNKKGLILYPTDTVWGIGCDATSETAVQKIYKLKRRNDSKALICLVSDFEMLKNYISNIPEVVYDILNKAKKPTTIIYNNPKGLAKNLIAVDNTIAIRIPNHDFCQKLIKTLGKPIVSTSANISGEITPKSFKEISAQILNDVDYIVNLSGSNLDTNPSKIIKLNSDGSITTIRE